MHEGLRNFVASGALDCAAIENLFLALGIDPEVIEMARADRERHWQERWDMLDKLPEDERQEMLRLKAMGFEKTFTKGV